MSVRRGTVIVQLINVSLWLVGIIRFVGFVRFGCRTAIIIHWIFSTILVHDENPQGQKGEKDGRDKDQIETC